MIHLHYARLASPVDRRHIFDIWVKSNNEKRKRGLNFSLYTKRTAAVVSNSCPDTESKRVSESGRWMNGYRRAGGNPPVGHAAHGFCIADCRNARGIALCRGGVVSLDLFDVEGTVGCV